MVALAVGPLLPQMNSSFHHQYISSLSVCCMYLCVLPVSQLLLGLA